MLRDTEQLGTASLRGIGARGSLGLLLLLTLAAARPAWGWLQPSVIGGREAKPHSRPYMVSLQLGEAHICGGALLKKRWVLTAAHCLRPGMKAVVGLHNLKDRAAAKICIRAAFPHPNYDPQTMENDLLLLQLEKTVTLSRTRQIIKLLGREPAAGAACSLAGWGVRKDGRLSPTLQELEVKVLDARMCNNSRFWNGGISPTMICFQGRHRGSTPSKWPEPQQHFQATGRHLDREAHEMDPENAAKGLQLAPAQTRGTDRAPLPVYTGQLPSPVT